MKKVTIIKLLLLVVLIIIIIIVLKNNMIYYQYLIKEISVKSSAPYVFVTKWGSKGSMSGQFIHPRAIALDSKGNVYVVDNGNYRIQKFSSRGKFITKWGRKGSDEGEFKYPTDIFVDLKDHVYVADYSNNCIQEFDCNGQFLHKWNGSSPLAIAVNLKEGVIYFSDATINIQKISCLGRPLIKWQVGDLTLESDQKLYDLEIDSSGDIYISHFSVYSTKEEDKLDYEVEGHSYIYQYNSSGDEIELNHDVGVSRYFYYLVMGIALDSKNNLFVAETGFNRIQVYAPDGRLIAEWGTKGSWNGDFNGPVDIAVDIEGNIYVVDCGNCRIQKFRPNPKFNSNDVKEDK